MSAAHRFVHNARKQENLIRCFAVAIVLLLLSHAGPDVSRLRGIFRDFLWAGLQWGRWR
jgi:hypothetical protein